MWGVIFTACVVFSFFPFPAPSLLQPTGSPLCAYYVHACRADVQLHLGLSGVAVTGAVLCLLWVLWAVKLGRRHRHLEADKGFKTHGTSRGMLSHR
jgi:hypothetical protein